MLQSGACHLQTDTRLRALAFLGPFQPSGTWMELVRWNGVKALWESEINRF
jgi:hypothetical protein